MFVLLFENPQTSSEVSWNKIIKHRAPTVLQIFFLPILYQNIQSTNFPYKMFSDEDNTFCGYCSKSLQLLPLSPL